MCVCAWYKNIYTFRIYIFPQIKKHIWTLINYDFLFNLNIGISEMTQLKCLWDLQNFTHKSDFVQASLFLFFQPAEKDELGYVIWHPLASLNLFSIICLEDKQRMSFSL